HVDHGKTLLLDRIREANVVAGEAGGITQHIGAYQADKDGRLITFIDTPGHEAFTAMRARGAEATDIAVLVVAADDGVMPTTIEAISHARAAEVPIVVAINKIDRDNADPTRVMQQLAEQGLNPEQWGGDTIMVELSALPSAGDEFRVAPDDKTARTVAEARERRYRERDLKRAPTGMAHGAKLEDIFEQIQRGETATLNLIVKAVVQGSLEAVTDSLRKLERDNVKLSFVHRGVGGITENDVQLGAASSATIIGFNVRPDRKARELAESEAVEIRTYQ